MQAQRNEATCTGSQSQLAPWGLGSRLSRARAHILSCSLLRAVSHSWGRVSSLTLESWSSRLQGPRLCLIKGCFFFSPQPSPHAVGTGTGRAAPYLLHFSGTGKEPPDVKAHREANLGQDVLQLAVPGRPVLRVQLLLCCLLLAACLASHIQNTLLVVHGLSRASRSATDLVTCSLLCSRWVTLLFFLGIGPPWVAQPCFPARGEGGTCCRQLLLIQGPLETRRAGEGLLTTPDRWGARGHDPVNSLAHSEAGQWP